MPGILMQRVYCIVRGLLACLVVRPVSCLYDIIFRDKMVFLLPVKEGRFSNLLRIVLFTQDWNSEIYFDQNCDLTVFIFVDTIIKTSFYPMEAFYLKTAM